MGKKMFFPTIKKAESSKKFEQKKEVSDTIKKRGLKGGLKGGFSEAPYKKGFGTK